MNADTFARLTAGRTPLPALVVERCHAAARAYRAQQLAAEHAPSGADQADAPRYGLVADVYALLAAGAHPQAVHDFAASTWRTYALEAQAAVERAPRVRRGPCAGHSVIGHRWVPLEVEDFVRAIVAVAYWLDEHARVAAIVANRVAPEECT